MTDIKERETIMKKDKQGSVVNLCRRLHISVMAEVMALCIDWVGEIEIDMQSSKKGQGRGSIQSPLILFYSVVDIYAITDMYTDYTQ